MLYPIRSKIIIVSTSIILFVLKCIFFFSFIERKSVMSFHMHASRALFFMHVRTATTAQAQMYQMRTISTNLKTFTKILPKHTSLKGVQLFKSIQVSEYSCPAQDVTSSKKGHVNIDGNRGPHETSKDVKPFDKIPGPLRLPILGTLLPYFTGKY